MRSGPALDDVHERARDEAPNRAEPRGDELLPDPRPERESAEYYAWDGAMNAIDNG